MTAPSTIRSTAGFRSLNLFELNSAGYPIGALTLQNQTPYTVSGSVISGSAAAVAAGAVVSGSNGYYGIRASGAKVLTMNDPQPRVIVHPGDDAIITLQTLPSLEAPSGEVRLDKKNDIVDAIVGNIKRFTVGEMNLQGVITNQRGYENQVGALAYSAAQDTDPDSANFGKSIWDFRVFPKATIFQRETGYGQQENERMYTFVPAMVTSHLWGGSFSISTEGFTVAQVLAGVCEYKPTLVSYLGDGTTQAFPFDSARPAALAAKVNVFKNGVLQSSGVTASVRGVVFTAAPSLNDVIVVVYEAS